MGGPQAILAFWQLLVTGLLVTLEIAALTCAISLIVGVPLGVTRALAPRFVRVVVGAYVDIMRAVPLLVVILYSYFALPVLIRVAIHAIPAAVLGLSAWWAAVIAEAVRGGVESIRPGQRMAGLALGMSETQCIRRIILPQAMVRMIPVITSTFVMVVLSTALASVVAAPELLTQSTIVSTETNQPFTILTLDLIVYLVVAYPVGWAGSWLYGRLQSRGIG